jgi:hypothetical protein
MGFLDKAKKLAEQAQTKLDEVQKQVNSSGSSSTMPPSGPVVEYDKHGRPIPQQPQEATGGPQGDPLMGGHHAPPAPPTGPMLDPSAPPAAAPEFGDPLAGPPASSQGDPLAAPPAPPAPPVSVAPPTTPGVPPTEPPSAQPAPVEASSPPPAPPMPGAPSTERDDPNPPSYAPPKMTGGDPLAG